MWHLIIFHSSCEYLKNVARILTTKFNTEVAWTDNTWYAVFAFQKHQDYLDFWAPSTSHACDNCNTHCFGAWLQFCQYRKTPRWLCLVYLHMSSSGSYVSFPKCTGFIQVLKWAENIMPVLWSLVSVVFCEASSTHMTGRWLFFTLGHHINKCWLTSEGWESRE